MNLSTLKPGFVRSLGRVTATCAARGVTPDQVTTTGLVLGLAGGVAVAVGTFEPLALLAVPPLVLARLAANAVYGQLARETGASSRRGAIANEVADRVGDLATIAPLALVAPVATAVSLVGVLATEWAAALDWAVHGTRRAAGPFGKPDRLAVVALGAVVGVARPEALGVTAVVLAGGAWLATAVRVGAGLRGAR